ncbi:MAG TPA: proton-conducting transporter membrane subunit, partial [Candidatus Rifleibacterium sp.]|nr:proton-conducting transporter membrane subunit [Candidatus Rifleibacterium sp.]
AMLHAICHSLVKSSLFLLAGNILSAFDTKKVEKVTGLLKSLPYTGMLWLAGFLAITGTPPFGTFISEFTILRAALVTRSWYIAAFYLLFLLIVFIGMLTIFMQMTQGVQSEKPLSSGDHHRDDHDSPHKHTRKHGRHHAPAEEHEVSETVLQLITPVFFLSAAVVLGFYLPDSFRTAINGAATLLGGAIL